MKKKSFLKVIILLFVFFCAGKVLAFDEGAVRDFLNTTGEKLIQTLGLEDKEARYQILDQMFDENIDVEYMGRYVLGRYYKTLNDEQKARYTALFARYIKSLYKSYPIDFKTEEIGFEILKAHEMPKHIEATAVVDIPEKYRTEGLEQVKVEFRIHQKENIFLIADLKIADVSMLLTLRQKFMQMMKDADEEPSWFLEDFEDLTVSNEMSLDLN